MHLNYHYYYYKGTVRREEKPCLRAEKDEFTGSTSSDLENINMALGKYGGPGSLKGHYNTPKCPRQGLLVGNVIELETRGIFTSPSLQM